MDCKNCQTTLSDQSNYCNLCGGKIIYNRLNFRNLFEHISETFLNYDNKLWRTIIGLLRHPSRVVEDYVSGIRNRYVNPISLFALGLTLSGLSVFLMKKFYLEHLDVTEILRSYDLYNEKSLESMRDTTSSTLEYTSLIYSALVPLFAVISAIIFYDKKYNFTEHIVLFLYTMAIFSMISVFTSQIVLLLIPDYYLLLSVLTYLVMFVYHAILLKRLFKLTRWEIILRSILFLILFFCLYLGFSLLLVAILLLTGEIDISQFRPK